MLNHTVIMGRLTKDPELRRTGSGTPVASFSLAVERDYKDDSGEKPVDFIDCVAWRGTAEFVAQYFTKGRMAVVSGRLQTRTWEKAGQKHKAAEIVAENVYFGDSRPKVETAPGRYADPEEWYTEPAADPGAFADFQPTDDDDAHLPF